MSKKGVMQHIGRETVFTPLDTWEREYLLYCKLMCYRTFYCFRLWKSFYNWRKTIIRKKYKNAQTFLNDNLFILNKELRNGLLGLQLMCEKMTNITFIDDKCIENFLLFYFIENQVRRSFFLNININNIDV